MTEAINDLTYHEPLYLEVKLTLQMVGIHLVIEHPQVEFNIYINELNNWPSSRIVKIKPDGQWGQVLGTSAVYKHPNGYQPCIWVAEDHWMLCWITFTGVDTWREGDGLTAFCQALQEVMKLDE